MRVARRAATQGFNAPACVRVVRAAEDGFTAEVGSSRPLSIELRWVDLREVQTLDLSEDCDGLNICSELPWRTNMGMWVPDPPAGPWALECLHYGGTEAACTERVD